MTEAQSNHEEGFVRSFIRKDKRERCLSLLSAPKGRRKFTDELAHFKWLNSQFAHAIPSATAHTVQEISALLRSKGAGRTVWVISEDCTFDAKEHTLEEALAHVWGRGIGSVLSCVPGRLAYFEDEEKTRLLER